MSQQSDKHTIEEEQVQLNSSEGHENVQLTLDIQPYNQNVDVDIPGACAICSITFAINATIKEVERRFTLESVLDLAISNEYFSTRGNGTHPKSCVEIGKLFGAVEWGYFGGENKNGYELIRRQLKRGLAVIVGVKMNLFTKPTDIGHAVVIVGIDEKNRVKIADSFSRIATRQGIRKQFPYGKPIWVAKPGSYLAAWEEFDASWNSKDDYMSMSFEGDPAFVNFNPKDEDFRFWMTIDPSNL